MAYTRTYYSDISSDLYKNRGITVCSAINNPGNSKSGCNAQPATLDLKSRVENSNGAYFCLIPARNAGEGNN